MNLANHVELYDGTKTYISINGDALNDTKMTQMYPNWQTVKCIVYTDFDGSMDLGVQPLASARHTFQIDENKTDTQAISEISALIASYIEPNVRMATALETIAKGTDITSFKSVIERTAINPMLPSDLTKIGEYTFHNCTNLALTSLPAGVTSIGLYAFYKCINLALTSLPAGVTYIHMYAFSGCTNLALTSLPSGVTGIETYAFSGCTNLALTSIPAGVTRIWSGAFKNCTGLTSITFEGTPTSIDSTAFTGCTNLTTINVPWSEGAVANAPWGATNATINYNYVAEVE